MRNFHIARVVPLVNLTLRNKLNNDPALQSMSYDELRNYLARHHFIYGDGFSHVMTTLGNKSEELIFDLEILQKKWAKENDVNVDFSSHWQLKVVLEQLRKVNPDFVFLQGFTRITPKDISAHRTLYPNLKKVAVHSGYPGLVSGYSSDTIVFCGLPLICDLFAKEGVDNFLLYHGFDERVIEKLHHSDRKIPFSFIGSSGYGFGSGHKVRYWELLKLASNTPMQLWLDDRDDFFDSSTKQNPFSERPLKENFYEIQSTEWQNYPNPLAPLRYLVPPNRVHNPLYGLEYYQCLADSQLTYHRHGDISEVGAMRMFEATGVGTCLLTDSGSNMVDLFEPGKEVVTYNSLPDCVEKVEFLLANPAKASEIAKAAQKRVMREHTLYHRYEMVNECLQTYL